METNNGGLNFQAVIDIEQLKRDMARMKAEFEGMTKKAQKEGDKTQQIVNKMLKGATAYLTIQQARNFANQVIQIRGQFQQLNVAFETMLGNKAKADALMNQVVDFAAKTPFQLTEVAGGTKQLLAYRIEQEKIIPTLKALGDVSAGLSVPIGRLILNYGQVKTASKLTGRELRDFNMAGVPLIAELSKNLNKSETDIQAMVSAGKIGFKEVEEAFRTMTSEGGRFADLMDKQSGTITGKISNLYDAIDKMFNDIGKANEGIINSAIDGAGYLVENYEDVVEIIKELIFTYGVYKTALITTTVIQGIATEATKGYTLAQQINYKWLLLGEKAQKAFNASVLANPYVVIIGAIVGAGYAIYKYKTHLTETEKAQKRVTSAVAEFNAEVSTEKRQLDRLFIKLKNAEKGTKEWNNIRDTIVRNYGQYNDNLKTELETINGQKKAYDSLNLSIQDTIRLKFKENLTKELSENYQKVEQETRDNVYDFLKDELGNKTGKDGKLLVETIMYDLQEAFRTGHTGIIDNLKVFTDENFKGLFQGSGVRAKNKLKHLFDDLIEQAKALSTGNREIDIKFGIKKKNEDDLKGENEKIQKLRSRADVLKEIHDKKVLINNLQKKSKKGITAKEKEDLKAYKGELSNLNEELELLAGKKTSTPNKTSKPKFNEEEYKLQNKRKIEDLEHQKQQGIIDAMQEGLDKQYEQLKLDADRKLQLLERNKQDEIQRIKDAEKQKQEAQGKSYDATQGNKQINEVEGVFKNLTQTQVEQSQKIQDDFLKNTLNKYLTYEQQKTEINRKFNAERKVLEGKDEGKKNAENIKLLEKARQKELFELEKTAQGTKSVIAELFGDTTQMTEKQMSSLIDKAEEFIKSIKPTPENIENIKAIREQINKLKKTLDETETGFSRMGKNIDKIFKKGISNQERSKALNELSSDLQNASALANMFGDSLKAIGELSGNELFGDIAEGISTITEVAGKTVQGAETGMALGGTAGAIVGGALGFVSSVLGKITSAEKKHREALRKIRMSEMQSQQQYNQLLFEQKMLMEDAESIFGVDALAKGLGYLEAYNRSFEKLQSKLKKTEKELSINIFGKDYKLGIKSFTSELSSIMVKTGHKKTGLFGWGKGKDIYSSITEVYKDLITKEGELNVARAKSILQNREMSQEHKIQLQGIINLYEQTEEAQKQLDNYFKETFGELGSGLMDSIINSLKTGEDAFKTFSKRVGEILGNLGKQLIENLFISSKFKQLQKDIENVYRKGQKEGISKEDIAKNVRSLVVGFANNVKSDIDLMKDFAKTWQEETKEMGYDVWGTEKDETRESVKKGFASITQDEASDLNGKFTLMNELQKQGILLSKDISTSMKMLQDTSARQLKHLSGIEANTATLHQMKTDIGSMKSELQDINDNGIKLK